MFHALGVHLRARRILRLFLMKSYGEWTGAWAEGPVTLLERGQVTVFDLVGKVQCGEKCLAATACPSRDLVVNIPIVQNFRGRASL